MRLLIVLIPLAFLFLVFIAYLWALRDPKPQKPNSAERKELYELRNLVYRLDDLAFAHRELDSILAPQVIDEIRKTRRELE